MTATEPKLLLVTFPVDLGSRTTAHNLEKLLIGKMNVRVYPFTGRLAQHFDSRGVDRRANRWQRIVEIPRLWVELRAARKENRKILFHHISPALFSLPLLSRRDCFITTEWTRKLLEPIKLETISPWWLTWVHRMVLRRVAGVLPMTEAVRTSLLQDYHVGPSQVHRVAKPFEVERMRPTSEECHFPVKILFIGGDFERKGGDVLINWFKTKNPKSVQLTLVTNERVAAITGLHLERGVVPRSKKHTKLFQSHDVFALPTKSEGYPMVLGEAACYGLAIVTTKFAMGAPEIIENGANGYICESQEHVLSCLDDLCANPAKVWQMKIASRRRMLTHFGEDKVFQQYLKAIFGSES